MKNYKAIICYDGTEYSGWQIQNHRPTIQSELEKAFFKTFVKQVNIRAASRTDAGVHAYGQVIQFLSDIHCSAQQMCAAWNNHLPAAICIRSIEEVDTKFHPWYNVEQKTYWYQFFLETPLPFHACYGWFIQRSVDINKLKDCLSIFIGTHDFTSFASAQDRRTNKLYTIDDISLSYIPQENLYRITIKGARFMRHMIRRMIGASLFVAYQNQLSSMDLQQLLVSKNPNHPYINAPAQGLLLHSIIYKDYR